jgi:hypothetical protein
MAAPTYSQLRDEGLSEQAIQTLVCARDALAVGWPAHGIAHFLRISHQNHPLDVEDVWPDGTPEHWVDWMNFDPCDRELGLA